MESLPNQPIYYPQKSLKEKLITIISVLLGILVFIVIFWSIYRLANKKQENDEVESLPSLPPSLEDQTLKTDPFAILELPKDKAIIKVDKETIYGLDYEQAIKYFKPGLENNLNAENQKEIVKEVQEVLIKHSVLLQEGEKEEVFSLSKDVFDSKDKDYKKRLGLVAEAERHFQNVFSSDVSGEYFQIFFNNMDIPEMGIEKAKEITREKMEDLREKVANGSITIKEAGEIINQDTSLVEIDPYYEANSYGEFKITAKESSSFNDPTLNQEVLTLDVGEVSSILAGHDHEEKEAFFVVAKLSKKEKTKELSFEEWLKKTINTYNVISY